MQKIIAFICIIIFYSVNAAAFAGPIAPQGYTVNVIYDFSAIESGDKLISEAEGFWIPDIAGMDVTVSFENGTVTFNNMNIWGAFPSFSQDAVEATKAKTGWGFYVKNSGLLDTMIGAGFNDAGGVNRVLAEDQAFMLVDMEGNITVDTTLWNSNNSQAAIIIPAEFEGYVFIPYAAYIKNDSSEDGEPYDSAIGVATPIYSLNDGETLTYGEFFVYQSDLVIATPMPSSSPGVSASVQASIENNTIQATDVPGNSANPEVSDSGWIIWIAVAVAAVIAAAVITVIIKKKN